ncbi:hypothetical protein U9M48_032652 [Paspalum notatum var. saurae]|uniref:Uncharacterized protein n=1 Tax=Paspalum notatum var. saurae TaxID=547442 RepID=A0AAQ3U9R2_PASNO
MPSQPSLEMTEQGMLPAGDEEYVARSVLDSGRVASPLTRPEQNPLFVAQPRNQPRPVQKASSLRPGFCSVGGRDATPLPSIAHAAAHAHGDILASASWERRGRRPLHLGLVARRQAHLRHAQDGELDRAPVSYPLLSKKSLLEHLPSLATAVFLGITAINVLTSNQGVGHTVYVPTSSKGDDPTTTKDKRTNLRKFLVSMPYAMFLVGVAGVAMAMATKRNPGLLGCATGFLLFQLVLLLIQGGLVTLVRSDVQPTICVRFPYVWIKGRLVGKTKEKTEGNCEACGQSTVDGRSPHPAANGAESCPTCGGVARKVDTCEDCGESTVDGRSTNPADDGALKCPTCGGKARKVLMV